MPWRYNGADNKIEVVVEPDFHGDILALASKRSVWIVDTPGNRLMIDTAWRTGEDLNLCEVSRCNVENPNSRQENLIMIMGVLDDHYPSYEMIVHGLEPGELLTRMLKEEEGFDVSEPTPDGFVALRFPGVRERLNGRMTTDEIERMLRESIGKAVRVRMRTPKGHSAILAAKNVDEEGFSYRIIEDSDWYPGLECWSQFDEIVEVEPAGDLNPEL